MKKYLVGGAIRDLILNIPVKDKDWVVVGTTPDQMISKGYQQVSKNFPVFLHPKTREEYSLARTESKSGHGYTGFLTSSSPNITLEQDLKRRDLTINAIAQDCNGKFIDPYNGLKDIKNRILRHVSDAFVEEPLRILRVARFAAQLSHLGFRIAKETQNLIYSMVKNNELTYLSSDRIWKETEKALKTKNPHIFFLVLRKCDALKVIFPEIDNLFGIPAPIKWHPEIDTGKHTLMTLKIASMLSSSVAVRFASLCHDIGKGLTVPEKWPSHHGHGISGVQLIRNMSKRLSIPNAIRDLSCIVAEFHDVIHTIEYQSAYFLISFFNKIDVWRKPKILEQLLIVSEADAKGRYGKTNLVYSQSKYLNEALYIARSITSKSVINDGFKGKEVFNEIIKRRVNIIHLWIMNNIK